MICTAHMHNKRCQELLCVKIITVCFPWKRNSRLSVKRNKTKCWNTTQHIYRHTAFRPGKIFVMDMLILASSCAQNSSNTITLSTPQTVPTGWFNLLGPGCPERGPQPAYVTNVLIIQSSSFFNRTTWPFHTKPTSLRNWQPFQFNVNILSLPSCWVVPKKFSPGPTPVLGGSDHVFKIYVRLPT